MAHFYHHYLRLAGFLAATLLLDLINSYAPVFIVGHCFVDPNILASVTMGNLVFNVLFLSTTYGICSGLDTLLSQEHGKDNSSHDGRAHVQWTTVTLCIVGLPLYLTCLYATSVLGAFGQPPSLIANAGKFTRVLALACGAPLVIRTVQGKVLATTGVPWLPFVGTAIGTACQAFMLWFIFGSRCGGNDHLTAVRELPFFFKWFQWGEQDLFLGAAIGQATYAWSSIVFVGVYLIVTRNRTCPCGCCVRCTSKSRQTGNEQHALSSLLLPEHEESGGEKCIESAESVESVENVENVNNGPAPTAPTTPTAGFAMVLKLAIPSMLAMVGEWWSAEMRTIVAGWLPFTSIDTASVVVAANGVLYVLTVIYYQLPKSLGIAAGIRCGQALGAGNAVAARRACVVGVVAPLLLSLCVALLLSLVTGVSSFAAESIVSGRTHTNQTQAVVDLVVESSVPIALSVLGFSAMMPSISLLNGCGRNSEGLFVCGGGGGGWWWLLWLLLFSWTWCVDTCLTVSVCLWKTATLVTFVGCWVVGLPVAVVLGIPYRFGLSGIWWGNAMGLCTGGLLAVGKLCRIDWAEEVVLVRKRLAVQ